MRGVLLAGQIQYANPIVGAALKIDTLGAKFTRFNSNFSIQSRNENIKPPSFVCGVLESVRIGMLCRVGVYG
jgi:hypothetical protein